MRAVFERRTSSGLFAFWGGGFTQSFREIVSVRVKTPSNTNLVESVHALGSYRKSDSIPHVFVLNTAALFRCVVNF